jgi:hypothetical protein
MARMIPPQFIDTNGSAAEGRVFDALARLPDEVVVFHSRRWHDHSGAWVEEGEADFVIVDPDAGVLVAEVKGGAIEQRDGAWFQGVRGHIATEWIDPAGQARKGMHVLRRALNARVGAKSVLFGQLVWFPDVVWAGPAPLDSPPLLDLHALDDPQTAIASVFSHWKRGRSNKGGGGERITAALIDLLAPTLRLDPEPEPAERPKTALVEIAPTPTRRDPLSPLKARASAALVAFGRLVIDALRWVAMLPVDFAVLVLGLIGGILLFIGQACWRGWKAIVHFALGGSLIAALGGVVAFFGFHAERGPIWIGSSFAMAFVASVLATLNQGLETHATRVRDMLASRLAGTNT